MEAALAALVMLLLVAASLLRLRPLTFTRVIVHGLTFLAVFAGLLGMASLAFGAQLGFGSKRHWLAIGLAAVAIGFAFPGSSSLAERLLARYWPAQARPRQGKRWSSRRRGPG